MTKVVADVPMPAITEAIELLRDDLLYRWRRQSQKRALLRWRDRTQPPGVMARFLPGGKPYYHFSDRRFKYRKGKGYLPDYVKTGRFRDALKTRNPKSMNTGGTEVITKLSIDGGPLNALSNIKGVQREVVTKERVLIHRRAYTATRHYRSANSQHLHSATATVSVRAYDQHQMKFVHKRTPAIRSYRDEFQMTPQDEMLIREYNDEEFKATVRAHAFTKNGKAKKSVRDGARAALAGEF